MGANASRNEQRPNVSSSNESNSMNVKSNKSKCISLGWRRKKQSKSASHEEVIEDHYQPASSQQRLEPKTLALSQTQPTLLGSTMLINSWKVPSTSNITPPVTPISSDSSCSVDTFSLSQPTQETLMQIIRCFPFPSSPNASTENLASSSSKTIKSIQPIKLTIELEYDRMNNAFECKHETKVLRKRTDKSKKIDLDDDNSVKRNASIGNAIEPVHRRSALEKLAQVFISNSRMLKSAWYIPKKSTELLAIENSSKTSCAAEILIVLLIAECALVVRRKSTEYFYSYSAIDNLRIPYFFIR
ncbi:unnamed protein product [Anisakis simplex]|uniref:Uncharacterized protein n=1 Tax=Anisakis simplex TaxID=6269 RepID=A0A0M3K8W9_ANISI|nr:unnamed protein product [Anisakis simplex]